MTYNTIRNTAALSDHRLIEAKQYDTQNYVHMTYTHATKHKLMTDL